MTEITINPDQSLSVKWTGRKGRGSLFQTMAEGNAKDVNRLDKEQLWACLLAASSCPFPLGQGGKVYAMALENVRNGTYKMGEKWTAATLGECRKAYVLKCGDGCNAPHDSYLNIAAA